MKYKSEYNDECTAAQYITELIIINFAQKDKKILPQKFWLHEDWKKLYRSEIIFANSLLKIYPEQAIINALKRDDTKWMTSLRIKKWSEYIKEEIQKIVSISKKAINSIQIEVANTTNIKTIYKKSNLDRLRG